MDKFIKYKRIVKRFEPKDLESNLQDFFDELIKEGWEIIYYNEKHYNNVEIYMLYSIVTVVVGKKQSNVL